MQTPFKTTLLMVGVIAGAVLISSSVVRAEDSQGPKLAQCHLAEREPVDGVFDIPETVRGVKSTFDIQCFVGGPKEFSGMAVAEVRGENETDSRPFTNTAEVVLVPPVGQVNLASNEIFRPGTYQMLVKLSDKDGNKLDEATLNVRVAIGERYSVPSVGKAIDEGKTLEQALAESEQPSTVKWIPNLSWKWWAIIGGLLVLVVGGWFFARSRQ